MTAKPIHKENISQKKSSPYEVISAITAKLAGELSERKIKNALVLATEKTGSLRFGIYSKKSLSEKLDTNNLEVLFSSDVENSSHSKKIIKNKEPKKILLIPSSTPSIGIFIETNNTSDLTNFKNERNERNEIKEGTATIENTWLNTLADIIVNDFQSLEGKTALDRETKNLNAVLNKSDSIYSSWNIKKGWEKN